MSNSTPPTATPSAWLWGGFWAVLVASALFFRPILPVDETRYIGVAWEMWLRGDFLVPHLNGAAYSHKPPLLFWLINAGWGIFGVNDFWPRLVAPLFGLGCLAMTAQLGRRLWPGSSAPFLAPFMLLGCIYWGLYTTLTMFDLMLAFWALVGVYGLTMAWRGSAWRGWLLFGGAIGLGVLTKGPVILVYLLPSALFAPYWAIGENRPSWRGWYLGLMGGLVIGAALALGWALPAGESGGEAYRTAILFGQTTGRVVQSFAHQKPFWWYLAILPGLLLPWLVWPSLLKRLWRTYKESLAPDPGLRLALVWALSAFVIFSAISGKRPHYLLPMFPALALAGGLLVSKLSSGDFIKARWDMAPIAAIAILFGSIIALNPIISAQIGKPEYSDGVSLLWSLPLLGAGLAMLIRPPTAAIDRMMSISAVGALVVVIVHGIAQPRLDLAYNLEPLAKHLASAQARGYAIANMDKYHGQYNFLGRLTKPVAVTDARLLPKWLKQHPKSKVVSYHYTSPAVHKPEFFQPFRGRYIAVWDATRLAKNPKLAHRN